MILIFTQSHRLRLSIIVHMSRKAIGIRENTKSLLIWSHQVTRYWAWALAHRLRLEGRLPDEELLFFCTVSEIDRLIQTRDPGVISR